MTFERDNSQTTSRVIAANSRFANTYYAILGLHPSASVIEVRRAYRELSKRYHPDTTELSPEVATVQFQRLNEAYATLSNPDRPLSSGEIFALFILALTLLGCLLLAVIIAMLRGENAVTVAQLFLI